MARKPDDLRLLKLADFVRPSIIVIFKFNTVITLEVGRDGALAVQLLLLLLHNLGDFDLPSPPFSEGRLAARASSDTASQESLESAIDILIL